MQSRHNASVDGTRLDHGILVPLHTQRQCDPYSRHGITRGDDQSSTIHVGSWGQQGGLKEHWAPLER